MTIPIAAGLALSYGAQLLNNHINNHIQRSENNRTFERNKELARLQNQYNLEQWHRENTFNSPMNQRRRLESAGFNPNLAFSNGLQNTAALSPGMSAGTPSSSAPVGFGSPSSPTELALLNSQIKKNEADANAADSGSDLNRAQIDNIRTMTEEQQKSMAVSREYTQRQTAMIDEQVAALRASTEGQKLLNDKQSMENAVYSITADDLVESFRLNNRLLKSQEASNYASARNSNAMAQFQEFANRVVSEVHRNPENLIKLAQAWMDGKTISSEQLTSAIGENQRSGNYVSRDIHEKSSIGDSVVGGFGLMTSLFGNLLKHVPKL